MGLSAEQEQVLDRIAGAHGATRAQVALAWLLAHSPVTLVIAGTKTVSHLGENLAAGQLQLAASEVEELDRLV